MFNIVATNVRIPTCEKKRQRTQQQITREMPLPVNEKNAAFDNTIHGLCGNKACELAVETWWSGLGSVLLVSSSDFKATVNICKTCSGKPKKSTTILKSLSQFQPIDAVDTKRHPVKLYEICMKKNQ